MRTQPNLDVYSVGRKIITQNIAPHLDIDFDEPIDCHVKRCTNNDALLRMFDERDIILLSDFARHTRYPNKLHAMAIRRDWSPITKDSKVIGYTRLSIGSNKAIASLLKPQVDNKQTQRRHPPLPSNPSPRIKKTLLYKVQVDLAENGIVYVDSYMRKAYTARQLSKAVCSLRAKGWVIKSHKVNSRVESYSLNK